MNKYDSIISSISWLAVLNGVERQVSPLVLLLSQAVPTLTIVSLRVRQFTHRDHDIVQRKLVLPPSITHYVQQPAFNLDLAVHIRLQSTY